MGRPREFNEDDVLTRAIDLFGTRGFDAVSVDTALTYLGLNRSSFYKLYGSKHGLFRMALEKVCDQAEGGEINDQARDLVIVALVELAPTSSHLHELIQRGVDVCFHGNMDTLGQHMVSRAFQSPNLGE